VGVKVEGGKDRWKIERKTKKFYRKRTGERCICVPIMHETRNHARKMSSNLLFGLTTGTWELIITCISVSSLASCFGPSSV
jgi:hypothetical protein